MGDGRKGNSSDDTRIKQVYIEEDSDDDSGETLREIEPCSPVGEMVIDETLCYVTNYMNSHNTDSIVAMIVTYRDEEELNRANKAVFNIADAKHKECLKDIRETRRDTADRTRRDQTAYDIVHILRSL